VGDIISIIDMPPSDESSWWRGKRGFEVTVTLFVEVYTTYAWSNS